MNPLKNGLPYEFIEFLKDKDKMGNIEWVFFDVGSTLVNEEKPYFHRLRDIADASGESFEKIRNMAADFYTKRKKGDREVMRLYGLDNLEWHREEEELFPDVAGCLETLSKRYKIGVIANQTPGTEERLRKYGLLKYIKLIIASAEEGVFKPDPRIFEIALERAGCKAENAVMIGDRVDNDIIPAKKLGFKTIWLKRGLWKNWQVEGEEEKADYEVADLITIPGILP